MKNVNVTIANVIAWFEESEQCMLHNHAQKMIPTTTKDEEETVMIKVFDDDITYLEWCKLLKKDPKDDESMISWSEMQNNK